MTEPKPWLIGEAGTQARRHAPATLRNREAIADVLKAWLPGQGTVLEIASGSGEHIVYFASRFAALDWQPSDCEPAALESISAWAAQSGLSNIRPPMLIDVEQGHWPIDRAAALICINMLHISPWTACMALFRHALGVLSPGAPLVIYGPFVRHDVMTAPSNLEFDASLKQRNPLWGLRDLAEVDAVADEFGFARAPLIEMPANNLSLVYRRG